MASSSSGRKIIFAVISTMVIIVSNTVASSEVIVTPWCKNSVRVRIAQQKGIYASTPFTHIYSDEDINTPESGALIRTCEPGANQTLSPGNTFTWQNVQVNLATDGTLTFIRVDTNAKLFSAKASFEQSSVVKKEGFYKINLIMEAGDESERIYGLGQGNWTTEGGCATGSPQRVVPLQRNGQRVNLQQRKFHVSIPFIYSTSGYGFLFNMYGYGNVQVGEKGVGGMAWQAEAAKYLDFWVSSLPAKLPTTAAAPIYEQYADATGHAPLLREDAMIFWQSRNRYKSSAIALSIASRYKELKLPVGVLVIDYKNNVWDGDFSPNPQCYPSVKNLSVGIRNAINATTVFSFWPEAKNQSAEFSTLLKNGCLINPDLGGLAIDTTPAHCRELIWSQFLKPRYYDQGVSAFWLDETDGEGTGIGDGDHGYDTSFGPAGAFSNLWVNNWLSTFTDPVAKIGKEPPLALTRGVWAGGQRHGIVLWSSDIESTFEELASQVPQGVHASLSGIPWWTTDVGGYGCGKEQPNDSPYMQELIVRWYQFGTFSPVFRTHGCRKGPSEPNVAPCKPRQGSCGYNEVWSYGNQTQVHLTKYILVRAALKPYIQDLSKNVTAHGLPTMRPLWWEFPEDTNAVGVNDEYLLGPDILVAPVTTQGATSRHVYFPKGDNWRDIFNKTSPIIPGGSSKVVAAPLDYIPAYVRVGSLYSNILNSP